MSKSFCDAILITLESFTNFSQPKFIVVCQDRRCGTLENQLEMFYKYGGDRECFVSYSGYVYDRLGNKYKSIEEFEQTLNIKMKL